MGEGLGRNGPCPCGSQKKYKKCCLSSGLSSAHLAPKFRFEPGTYGDKGSFMPSISCLKQTGAGGWVYHFVLANPNRVEINEDDARLLATDDLNGAFVKRDEIGADEALARHLKQKGYVSIPDFKIVSEPGSFQNSWIDDEGLHMAGPGKPLSSEDLDRMTASYQKQIRESPLWNEIVQKVGEDEALRLLAECRAEAR